MKIRQFFPVVVLIGVMVASVHAQWPPQRGGAGDRMRGRDQGPKQALESPLQKGENPSERLGLDEVMWSGREIDDIESLKGKSVVVFVYATSDRKCDKWSGQLFKEIKMAIEDRPVVVLAINADRKDPTLRYVAQRDFSAPNILHGYDPNLPGRLGYADNLFHYVWIDSKGRVKKQGQMSSQAGGAAGGPGGNVGGEAPADRPVFTLAKELHEATDLGEFTLLQPGLPEGAAALLWPVEMGEPITNAILARVRGMLKGEQKEKFEKAAADYFDKLAARILKLAKGDVPERLEAYAMAEPFVRNLRALPQAKRVREVYDSLKKDRDFKKELAAMQLYERATAKGLAPQRRDGILRGLVRKYKDTYYGKKAAGEVEKR